MQARRLREHPAAKHLMRRRAGGKIVRLIKHLDMGGGVLHRLIRRRGLAGVQGDDEVLIAYRLVHLDLESQGLGRDLVQGLEHGDAVAGARQWDSGGL